MPNPHDDTLPARAPAMVTGTHLTCPPDHGTAEGWRTQGNVSIYHAAPNARVAYSPRRPSEIITGMHSSNLSSDAHARPKDETNALDMPTSPDEVVTSPTATSPYAESKESESADSLSTSPPPSATTSSSLLSSNWAFPSSPHPQPYFSSFLRHGSKFTGTQVSDKHQYKVEVNIKHVDVHDSFLCGYLRIEGLAKDHPSLTTYFEGEIIGSKHGFATKHPSWGATEKSDLSHWDRFPAFRPLAPRVRKQGGDAPLKNWPQREHVFMRWKEEFLVPDHRVREISGASFEGFYYICFSQVTGAISGIYYHAKSEKYQQLELKHVPDRGCFAAISFC